VNAWTYAQSLGSDRLRALASHTSFTEITERVLADAEPLCIHERASDDRAGFTRVVVTIEVPPPVFDLFFNSAAGYRGAYADSPFSGLKANHTFLGRLLSFVTTRFTQSATTPSPSLIRESLSSPSAKVWLAEVGPSLCDKCCGEWSTPQDETPEIFNGDTSARWSAGRCATSAIPAWSRRAARR
jgi:hypothetical protein